LQLQQYEQLRQQHTYLPISASVKFNRDTEVASGMSSFPLSTLRYSVTATE
jgi:hypothetical protein